MGDHHQLQHRRRDEEEDETRKGPWTEQEDLQLLLYVNLFGDRRWDFIAKVSGLKRTGKSCRLRWVNYLHPGLKRGKMTPQEERLVLELHSKWGNRWSRIARKLPGRTDNEIKNYWRTHMRKKAQEIKKKMANSPSSSLSNCSSTASNAYPAFSAPATDTKERSFYDTGGKMSSSDGKEERVKRFSVDNDDDEIWNDIVCSDEDSIKPVGTTSLGSPIWDYCADPLWMDGGEQTNRMFFPTIEQFSSFKWLNRI